MYDGIKRLRGVLARAAGAGEQPRTFWHGMGGARVTQEFMEQFTSKGGTEMAPGSTSDDEAVARHFAKWDEAACTDAVLTKVEAADHTCCGVDLAWLSMYAGEREVLFPPLTYLQPRLQQRSCRGACSGRCHGRDSSSAMTAVTLAAARGACNITAAAATVTAAGVAYETAKCNGCNGRCHAAAATATAVAMVHAGCDGSLGNLAGCIEVLAALCAAAAAAAAAER